MSEPLLIRYWYADGRPQAALPLHPVEDRRDLKAGWLTVGTEIFYWATTAGDDPRTLPLDGRFRSELTTAPRRWQGGDVLRVMPSGCPYQVLHFWSNDEFSGWYVNFESPLDWTGRVGDTRDWHLDLWVSPQGVATWKDEAEAAVAAECGHVRPAELDAARVVGQGIIEDFDRFLASVGDWRGLRPDRELRPLGLPRSWRTRGR